MDSRSQNHRSFVHEVLLLHLIYILTDAQQINLILYLSLAKGSDVEVIFHFLLLFQRFQIFLKILVSVRVAVSKVDYIIWVLKLVGKRKCVKVYTLKILGFLIGWIDEQRVLLSQILGKKGVFLVRNIFAVSVPLNAVLLVFFGGKDDWLQALFIQTFVFVKVDNVDLDFGF